MNSKNNFASEILAHTEHRPWPLPQNNWILQMSWTDLLFAHWPVPARELSPLLPIDYDIDTFDGTAWVGVVPFRMEHVRLRGLPQVPGLDRFLEANVRTYVRDRRTGQHGVYFFSLEAAHPLAVGIARAWYRLPYHLAHMRMRKTGEVWRYVSRRLLVTSRTALRAAYESGGQSLPLAKPGSIEHFLTERYALFTHSKTRLMRADIHHRPWDLEPADGEFFDLSLASAQGIKLPPVRPLLHFSARQDVLAWAPRIIE